MRGKGKNYKPFPSERRITPAYAGKSFNFGLDVNAFGDHPRVCGEKWEPTDLKQLYKRITPAYAGKRTALQC